MSPEAGNWSRPDAGVNPDDYLDDDRDVESHAESGPRPDDERAADPLAPGESILDESDGDVVEPNEPG